MAEALEGKRSPSSGASITDAGDVRSLNFLIECKHKGTFDKPAKSISVKLSDFEKIFDEASSEGRTPMLCLSIYSPDSILATRDGCVDFSVQLLSDVTHG